MSKQRCQIDDCGRWVRDMTDHYDRAHGELDGGGDDESPARPVRAERGSVAV